MNDKRARNQGVKFPFKILVSDQLTAGKYALSLQPNATLGDRLVNVANAFELYRINKLKFRLYPTPGTSIIAAFLPAFADTAPANLTQISEIVDSALQTTTMTMPGDWVDVNKSNLKGALPWYKTIAGAADSWDETAGTIYFADAGGTSNGFVLELKGEYEFKGPADPANTPSLKICKDERRRQELLRLLGSVEVAGPKEKLASSKLPVRPSGKAV